MFVVKKRIQGKEYYYLKVSGRVQGKPKSKTVAYLGKAPLTETQLKKKIQHIPKMKINSALKDLQQESIEFLSEDKRKEMIRIGKDFLKKLKTLDTKLLEDMFRDFKTHYIYNTNAIEGNSLTLEETSLLLNEQRTPEGKDLREIYDHLNEKNVFDELLESKPSINIVTVVDIHRKLLKDIDQRVGGFRRHNVRVVGASFETSPAEYVTTDMKILLRWYHQQKNKLHPLALAAIFHEKFEKIHPFYDGNGRTGRMILNLMLISRGLPPLIVKNHRRKEYYEALEAGHGADLTKIDQQHQKLVDFCYERLVETYQEIFSKWGDVVPKIIKKY
ncbi:MAG TPA: Fic family protein [Candidatus Nanoarchaeia archaeon]|nr:Fic family protein [Candidatus Nanoarchaeia archaeon]